MSIEQCLLYNDCLILTVTSNEYPHAFSSTSRSGVWYVHDNVLGQKWIYKLPLLGSVISFEFHEPNQHLSHLPSVVHFHSNGIYVESSVAVSKSRSLTFKYMDYHRCWLSVAWYTCVITRMLSICSQNGQLRIMIICKIRANIRKLEWFY